MPQNNYHDQYYYYYGCVLNKEVNTCNSFKAKTINHEEFKKQYLGNFELIEEDETRS
jgi:hypothetical protein